MSSGAAFYHYDYAGSFTAEYLTCVNCFSDLSIICSYSRLQPTINHSNFVGNVLGSSENGILRSHGSGMRVEECIFVTAPKYRDIYVISVRTKFEIANSFFSRGFPEERFASLTDCSVNETATHILEYLNTEACDISVIVPNPISRIATAVPSPTPGVWASSEIVDLSELLTVSPEPSQFAFSCVNFSGWTTRISINSGCCSIFDSSFLDLNSTQGGAISVSFSMSGSTTMIWDSTFDRCGVTMSSTNRGGGCYLFCSFISISGCCAANCGAYSGHFAYLEGPSNSSVQLSTFWQCAPNQAVHYWSGGIYCLKNVDFFSQHDNFTASQSYGWGPVLYFSNPTLWYDIRSVTVLNCSGDCTFYLRGNSHRTIEQSTFIHNRVDRPDVWAVVYGADYGATITSSVFKNNNALDVRCGSSQSKGYNLYSCSYSKPVREYYICTASATTVMTNADTGDVESWFLKNCAATPSQAFVLSALFSWTSPYRRSDPLSHSLAWDISSGIVHSDIHRFSSAFGSSLSLASIDSTGASS
jgi:hypothetical protein